MTGTFIAEVSWNADDDFADANENVTADVLAFSCRRGRDYASQLTGRSSAGQAQLVLRNMDGKYSRFNSSSPLFGLLLPGRKVRIRSTAPTAATLWTGFLDDIHPVAGGMPYATLIASGAFKQLADQANKVNAGPLVGALTSTVIGAVLDAAGWPAGARSIQAGVVPVGHWWAPDVVALEALQDMEDAEVGALFEGLNFDVVFEARYNRNLNAASVTSQGTFSDAAAAALPYMGLEQTDPLREVFNIFEAQVQPYSTGSLAVLWTLSDVPFNLTPGQSVTYIASFEADYVSAWTTPVVGTDVVQTGVANGDIGVVVSKTATRMFITLTNNHATAAAAISLLQARGIPVTRTDVYQVSASDATSITNYKRRKYPLVSPWYFNQAYAQAACDYYLSLKKDPHPVARIVLPAGTQDTLFAHAVQRNLSERITLVATGLLTKLGINQDFFIEAIEHAWSAESGLLETSWEVSPADAVADYWQLDVDELGVGTRLAF